MAPTTVNANNIFCNKCEEFTIVAIPPPLHSGDASCWELLPVIF